MDRPLDKLPEDEPEPEPEPDSDHMKTCHICNPNRRNLS